MYVDGRRSLLSKKPNLRRIILYSACVWAANSAKHEEKIRRYIQNRR